MNQMVATYAKYFSDDDIKGMIQFYETPAGQHYIAHLPQVTGGRSADCAGYIRGRYPGHLERTVHRISRVARADEVLSAA